MRQADPSPSPEELQRRIAALEAENEVLRQAGAALAGGLNLERLVQTVTDAGVQLVGAEFGAFFYSVTDASGQQYMLYTLSGAPREAFSRFPMPGRTALFAPTFDGESIIRSDDITQDPRYGHNAPHHGMPAGHLPVRSYLAVPVISRTGAVLGGLFFGHPKPGIFTERAERAIRSIAAQAAIAIDNAQLLQAVQNSERRFRALIERSADGIAVIDADNNIQYLSPAVSAIEGYAPEELVGGNGKDNTHPDDLKFIHETVRRTLENPGKPVPVLWRRRHKDGRWLWLEGTATNLLHDPAVRGIVTNYRDVTVRRRAEEAQIRSQKMEALGTLAGGIAHDFNNILLAITGNVKLAREDLPADHEIQSSLTEIAKASHRATELVRRILEFSRQQESQREIIELQPVVQEALKLLRSTLPAMIEIKATLAPDIPPVLADSTQIHQIMLNLITNAAHATGNDGGMIEVTVDAVTVRDELATALREGQYARITVSDDGCGMDKNTLERIFDPFFTTKPVGQGTGLGLSVVDGIVKNHDGTITVYSQLDKGTTFRVYLPAATGAVPAPEIKSPDAARGSGERVLYIDDDEAIVFLTTRILERLGYSVTGFTDPEQALARFRANPADFDIVVTDLSMPNMSGLDLTQALHQARPDIQILMTSGYVRPEDRDRARDHGVRELVLKPNSVEELGHALDRLFKELRQ
jgi:PAS domain S-box-containing protein